MTYTINLNDLIADARYESKREKLIEAARRDIDRMAEQSRNMVREMMLDPAEPKTRAAKYLRICRQYDNEWYLANKAQIERIAKRRKPAKRGPKPGHIKPASMANLIPGPHKGPRW